MKFDYWSPAELFTAKLKGGPRQQLDYRRVASTGPSDLQTYRSGW
ncbi:MAG TPA: hypothetical protein VKC66_11850 [Xanthobacteraceae bacterium]|nr:hypothetical protein [Xanthobacteraceae bacterium]